MTDKVMIHVERLTKDYGSGRPAVDAISFDVRAGEVLDRKSTRLNSSHRP